MTMEKEVVEILFCCLADAIICKLLFRKCCIQDSTKIILFLSMLVQEYKRHIEFRQRKKEKAIKKLKAAFDAFLIALMRYNINEFTLKPS